MKLAKGVDISKLKTVLVTDCGSTTTKALLFEKKKDELQKKADEIVHEYLRKEFSDYINNERVILD